MSLPSPIRTRSAVVAAVLRHRHLWLGLALLTGAINLLMLTPTLYMLQVYDRVMISQSELTLIAVSLLTLGLFVLMAGIEVLRARLLLRVSAAIEAAWARRVFSASFRASLGALSSGGARMLGDLTQVRQFASGPGALAVFDAPWAPLYLGVLFLLHPLLGWTGIVCALVQAGLAWWSQRRAMAPVRASTAADEAEAVLLRSAMRHAETAEAMGMVPALRGRWQARHQAVLAAGDAQRADEQRLAALSRFVRQAQQSLGLGLGALLVIRGELSGGAMIAANVLMTRSLAPIDALVGQWRVAQNALDAWRRLQQLVREHAPAAAEPAVLPTQPLLELQRVCATLPDRETPLIAPLDLRLEPATVTVVLGASGSGKSTLLRLMLGIWPDAGGSVLLGDRPLAAYDREALGPLLGYLPQDVELFEGSIADNIARCARPDSPRVLAAAQACGLHELILRLPRGYDTPAGDAGHLLSGGQRQRIGLARAVYGGPALLVLDEPNANLDDAGEVALSRLVQTERARGCTVVVASHRPAILAVADRVIVLDAGRVRLDGPRDAVLAALRPAAAAASSAPVSTAAAAARVGTTAPAHSTALSIA